MTAPVIKTTPIKTPLRLTLDTGPRALSLDEVMARGRAFDGNPLAVRGSGTAIIPAVLAGGGLPKSPRS